MTFDTKITKDCQLARYFQSHEDIGTNEAKNIDKPISAILNFFMNSKKSKTKKIARVYGKLKIK